MTCCSNRSFCNSPLEDILPPWFFWLVSDHGFFSFNCFSDQNEIRLLWNVFIYTVNSSWCSGVWTDKKQYWLDFLRITSVKNLHWMRGCGNVLTTGHVGIKTSLTAGFALSCNSEAFSSTNTDFTRRKKRISFPSTHYAGTNCNTITSTFVLCNGLMCCSITVLWRIHDSTFFSSGLCQHCAIGRHRSYYGTYTWLCPAEDWTLHKRSNSNRCTHFC